MEGTSWQPANKDSEVEAFRLYRRQIAADPSREVAMIYNHDVKEWAVVQGGADSVALGQTLARLGWNPRATVVGRHSHPVSGHQGALQELTHFPSGRGFDLDVVRNDSYKGSVVDGNQWHAIDITVDDKPDRTWVVYSHKTGEWTVDYPDKGERGGRGQRTFATTDEYHAWFKDRFGVDVRHEPRGGAPETLTPDQLSLETDMERLARLREQVDQLVHGQGLRPAPSDPMDAARSRDQLEGAQKVLATEGSDGRARDESIAEVIEQSVASTRAMHTGTDQALTAEALAGYCGEHRDVTADSIISLVSDSAVPIVVERVQVGTVMPGQGHSIVLVRLPGGKTYLVDTTFAQFFHGGPHNPDAAGTGEAMMTRPEGAEVAATLLRDGVIPLTPETARQYMLGLGADPAEAGAMGTRLMAGEASFLIDVVQNGRVERLPNSDAGDLDNIRNVVTPGERGGSVDYVRGILAGLDPKDPRMPLLEDLAARLESLHQKTQPAQAAI